MWYMMWYLILMCSTSKGVCGKWGDILYECVTQVKVYVEYDVVSDINVFHK